MGMWWAEKEGDAVGAAQRACGVVVEALALMASRTELMLRAMGRGRAAS